MTEHRELGADTWFLVLHVIGSLDAWPVVLAVAGAVPESKGGTASASAALPRPAAAPLT